MLKLEVATFNGLPPPLPLSADIDEMGGSIGRADGNTLVLPDEKRYISRTQAEIVYRASGYVLRDVGSATPTSINGKPLGNGNEAALRDGDEIAVGDYVLRVSVVGSGVAHATPAVAEDPFADLLAPPGAVPRPAHSPAPAAHPSSLLDDPFALPAASAARPQQSGVIPADFDPFADLMPSSPPAPAATPAPSVSAFGDDLNLAPSSGQSVDDLFGLNAGSSWDPLGPQDPISGADVLPGAVGNDPLAAFSRQPQRAPAPPQRDDAPMLSGAFQPPRARPESPPAPSPAAPASQSPAAARAAPADMVLSWNTGQSAPPTGEIKTVILPSPKRAVASTPQPLEQNAVRPAATPAAAPPPAARPAPVAAAAAPVPPAASAVTPASDELLRAFLEGAGLTEMRIPAGLTPELMGLIGELLRESLRGTLDLLLARALTKREVRAQATVIVAKENNPLKFSPTVEAAFNHLLAPQGQGFMAPAAAMRDAYNDLRSHQFGFMAGMRAALEGVLTRFDPAQLESRLTHKSMLGTLVPASRRARMWELYEQMYREISKEAQDDFQTLFGKEFLRAYEAQIDKLEQEDAANRR